ncbi:PIN domain-containing protein [Methanocaldococcus infernus]
MKVVLDASAVIHGFNPLNYEECYITPKVYEEVKENRIFLDQAISLGKLKILEPKKESIEKVRNLANKVGELLSEADIEVLALAYELKALILTDDYGIQNIAKRLNIKHKGIYYNKTNKIIVWRKVCLGCKKSYPIIYEYDECEVCGSPLKRKAVKVKREGK